MEYRLKKQIIIAGVFTVIVAVVLSIFIVSKRTPPSCFDGILNQNEEKVDCGGACTPCAEFYFENIKVESTGILYFDGGYDVFVKIKNTNSQHGTGSLRYTFKFYDKDNNFLSEKKGKSYVLAGQTRYIMESNIDVDGRPVTVKFEYDPIIWQEQERTAIKLPIFSKKYEGDLSDTNNDVHSQVTGIIENQANYSFVDVDISVMLYDENDSLLSINQTKINNLRAGERRDVVIPWFSEIKGNVNGVYIEASANAFDDANILR